MILSSQFLYSTQNSLEDTNLKLTTGTKEKEGGRERGGSGRGGEGCEAGRLEGKEFGLTAFCPGQKSM